MWIQQILFEQEIPGGGRSFHRLYPFSNQSKGKDPSTKDRGSHLDPSKILDVLNKIMFYVWCLPIAVL